MEEINLPGLNSLPVSKVPTMAVRKDVEKVSMMAAKMVTMTVVETPQVIALRRL